ncbi:hypothetical protein [Brachyspira hyodysenteriae]
MTLKAGMDNKEASTVLFGDIGFVGLCCSIFAIMQDKLNSIWNNYR